jgi:hypothetical protein
MSIVAMQYIRVEKINNGRKDTFTKLTLFNSNNKMVYTTPKAIDANTTNGIVTNKFIIISFLFPT